MQQWILAVGSELDVVRQRNRQLLVRHRHDAMLWAIDDGDGHAPVALPRDQPVAQPKGDGPLADATAFGLGNDLRQAVFDAEPAVGIGVDEEALIGLKRGLEWPSGRFRGRADDLTDRELIFLRELEVARVVGGHAHDRPRAISGEDVVRDPDRDALVRKWVDRRGAGEYPGLHMLGREALDLGLAFGLLDVVVDVAPVVGRDDLLNELVLGRDHHEGGAEDGIRSGGEHLEATVAFDLEVQIGALAAPDPVGLHHLDAFRPAVELLQVVE